MCQNFSCFGNENLGSVQVELNERGFVESLLVADKKVICFNVDLRGRSPIILR